MPAREAFIGYFTTRQVDALNDRVPGQLEAIVWSFRSSVFLNTIMQKVLNLRTAGRTPSVLDDQV